jgi:hypothetical protein
MNIAKAMLEIKISANDSNEPVVKKCHPPVTLCTAACSINAAS